MLLKLGAPATRSGMPFPSRSSTTAVLHPSRSKGPGPSQTARGSHEAPDTTAMPPAPTPVGGEPEGQPKIRSGIPSPSWSKEPKARHSGQGQEVGDPRVARRSAIGELE